MANRHQSRICAMQSLYEFDLRPSAKLTEILNRNFTEKPNTDEDFVKNTISGVIKHTKEIDKLIADSAPEWPLEQIARVDKNVLRIAVFELLYEDKDKRVPPKVAIDEAVEIAKNFGGENSSKFVNGVLGTIYRHSDVYVKEDDNKFENKRAKSKNAE